MTNVRSLLPAISLLCTIGLYGQEAPITWGEIPEEDFEIKACAFDPEADAIVLDDYGLIQVKQTQVEVYYYFKRHRRIKVLKESGGSYGNVRLIGHGDLTSFNIGSHLKAHTIDSNGVVTRVNDNSIFIQKVNESATTVQFSFKNVHPGAILEYTLTSKSPRIEQLPLWYFQEDIPVRHSLLHVEVPPTMGYVWLTNAGHIIESGSGKVKVDSRGVLPSGHNNLLTFRLDNSPGIKDASFTTDIAHYRHQIKFQLSEVFTSDGHKHTFIPDWEELARTIDTHAQMGAQYQKKKNHKGLLKHLPAVIQGARSDEERIMAIHNFLVRNVKWDETYSLFASHDLDASFAEGQGNSAELNYMFMSLARATGLEVQPVLISIRSSGPPYENYPLVDQFDHVLAAVHVGDKHILVDVHSPHAPFDLLAPESLNFRGWLADPENPGWIDITPRTASRVAKLSIDLRTDEPEGTLQSRYSGYAAFERREQGQEFPETRRSQLATLFPEIAIREVKLSRFDETDKSLAEEVKFGIAIDQQDFLYINPFVMSDFSTSPLKKPNRTYPVDFAYPRRETLSTTITFDPARYDVEELPEEFAFALPDDGGKCHLFVSEKEGQIDFTYRLELSRQRYDAALYQAMREFFLNVERQLGESVVLKNISGQ